MGAEIRAVEGTQLHPYFCGDRGTGGAAANGNRTERVREVSNRCSLRCLGFNRHL